jgi:hypothetical protein
LEERGEIAAARVIRYEKKEMADHEILDLGNSGGEKVNELFFKKRPRSGIYLL